MQFKTAAILIFVLAVALPGCQTRSDEYGLGQSYKRMSKGDAENAVVQLSLRTQVEPPLDSPLRIVHVALPSYPEQWKRLKSIRAQRVTVQFSILSEGTVTNATVVGAAEPELADLCLAAVRAWQFAPISRSGNPAEVRLILNFVFKLEN